MLASARDRKEQPFLLLLDEIEDPHNLGALLRTAECAGAHGVIVPRHHTSPMTATVVKASAGASLHLPIAKVTNLAATIGSLQEAGIWVVGTDERAPKSYREIDYRSPVAIVIGNEGKGMRRLVKERCDELVRIPLFGKIASLNASVAGGLVLFEVARSRSSR
jgi:23S rRNA (guanosine2251-2'-O)-methyltransferase